MKRVAIVGGGISGVFASIRIKELHPDYDVSVFEHNDKLLKKIYATGNGKCNFANLGSLEDKYNNDLAIKIINEFNAQDIINYFKNLGIISKSIGDNIYPYSESAETVAVHLLKRFDELNIKAYLSTKVLDYTNNKLITDIGEFSFDELVISSGGKASSHLGSDGSLFDVLIRHGYNLKEFHPCLCPIKTKENTKMVEGIRAKANVALYQNNVLLHEENGEILFKKDGLSGMVIFNITNYINRLKDSKNVTIHIDFAKNEDGDYDSLVHPKLANYLKNNNIDIHNAVFSFKNFYEYQISHISSGGVSLEQIDSSLKSKKEDNVHFTGEVLDIDAVCGGFNIMWALASANKVAMDM